MSKAFRSLERSFGAGNFVCVGLDSDFDKIPSSVKEKARRKAGRGVFVYSAILRFNCNIVDATVDIVAAYKLNSAFYEAQGHFGIRALRDTIGYIKRASKDIFVILDAKRGDTENTNESYAKFAFDYLGADAITVSPYMGLAALGPFFERKDKGVFVLCKTSNPGSSEFQNQGSLYQAVAMACRAKWDENENCGLVVGATYPEEMSQIRKIVGDAPFLVPGIGAQGGDLELVIKNGMTSNGAGLIINASRSVIFASPDVGFEMAARESVVRLNREIQYIQRQ